MSHRLSEEPPDAAWLEEESARRREAWESQRHQRLLARRAAREREPLFRRVFKLEALLALSSTSPAARIGGTGGGGSGPDSAIPPRAERTFSGEHPAEVARLFRLMRDTVVRLEQLADGDRRPPMMTEDIDDVLVREFEGYTPEECCELEPTFGSPAAVVKVRRAKDRHAKDGTRVES